MYIPSIHFFHHQAHLFKLVEHAVHFLNLHPGTCCNAAFATGLDDVGFFALQFGHGVDDALHAAHVALGLVHVARLGLAGQLGRQLVHQRRQAAHLLHLAELGQEVVQVETRPALELGGQFAGRFLVDVGLGLLDQRDDVAHARSG